MELMFPPHCLFCGEVKPFRENCPDCAELETKNRLTGERRFNYQFLTRSTKNVTATISSYIYSDEVANLIARYKFRRYYTMAREMAKIMAADILELLGADCCDLVLPVPAHESGVSQHSALLAKRVAKILEKQYSNEILTKGKETKPQHRLSFAERAENLKGVFSVIKAEEVENKRILLCDDVMTSGNTLNECAAALLAAGAAEVLAATFAATSASPRSSGDEQRQSDAEKRQFDAEKQASDGKDSGDEGGSRKLKKKKSSDKKRKNRKKKAEKPDEPRT